MDKPLPGYLMKLDRGLIHRNSLDEVAQRWLKRNCRAILKTDSQTGEHVLRAQISGHPPPELSLMLGDCIHNMRAALDHIAYQLAISFSKSLLDSQLKSVEFPIFIHPDKFRQRSKKGNPAPSSGLFKIKLIDPAAQALIESMQPYHGGDWELLSLLHDLDRIDKHRELNLSVAATESFEFNCGKGGGMPEQMVFNPPGPIEDEADLVRFRCRPVIGNKDQAKPEANSTFTIALAEGPRCWSVIDQLREIDSLIRSKVIPPLMPFL